MVSKKMCLTDMAITLSLTLPVVETRGFSVLRGLPSETCPFVREGGPIKKHRIYRCGFFKEIEMRDVKCLPVIKFASVCEFDDYLHLAT